MDINLLMNIEYCDKICIEVMNWAKYDEPDKYTGVRHYEKSAREIEAELYCNYFLKDRIDLVDYHYIFGRICINALAVGGEDFFRV